MTHPSDVIRAALEALCKQLPEGANCNPAAHILGAVAEMESRCVPPCPNGFIWSGFDHGKHGWDASIYRLINGFDNSESYFGNGPTIAAACANAIAKIGEKS